MPFPDGARPIVVVGDRFSAFARAVGAWTVSDLVRVLENGEGPERTVPLEIRFGQGVGAYEAGYLRDVLVRHGYAAGGVAALPGDAGLVGRRQVHKTRADNVLLGALREEGGGVYTACLRLHNDNELVADLQDLIVHVQGMVAVEAIRQMFTAVTETFVLAERPACRYYLVINSMDVTFGNFLFPLPARLRLTMNHADLRGPPLRASGGGGLRPHPVDVPAPGRRPPPPRPCRHAGPLTARPRAAPPGRRGARPP